ncbi:MAG: OmpA family protein [Oceanospirillaceae bacterium]|nr:OmpA family protein [Oceanospirillaceae bacterium]
MNPKSLPILLVLSSAVLSGCSVYSTAVNSLGPETPKSDLEQPEGGYALSTVAPLFCPAPERIMIMPEDNKGAVDVRLNNGEFYELRGDYSAVSISELERKQYVGDTGELFDFAGTAIEHIPPAPTYFTVNFKNDLTEFTEESAALVEDILAEIAARPVPEVLIVGHTDTTASASYNMQLSMRRAELVRDLLIERGVDEKLVITEAYGEQDLLIKTADNVSEVLNRRVVIGVR